MSSRSFGQPLYRLSELREAVASYTSRACWKLRQKGLVARGAQVFIQTNRFRSWEPQQSRSAFAPLLVPTDCTHEIASALQRALEGIYEEGYAYHKAGVLLLDLVSSQMVQQGLFDGVDRDKQSRLMTALDALNTTMGPGSVRYASEGKRKVPTWGMRQAHKSPRYTTRLDELWTVG